MEALKIEILNPKALQLIKGMEDLKWISIKETSRDGFFEVVKKIRKKAEKKSRAFEDITKEVEYVRSRRYAQKDK